MRILAAVLSVLLFCWPAAQAEIFEGERLVQVDGKTGLVRFLKGSRGRPLIVLERDRATTDAVRDVKSILGLA